MRRMNVLLLRLLRSTCDVHIFSSTGFPVRCTYRPCDFWRRVPPLLTRPFLEDFHNLAVIFEGITDHDTRRTSPC